MTTASENRELKNAILQSRKLLLHIGGFSFFVNLLMLTGPLYMLQVYDRVVTSRSLSTLAALTLLILVLYSALGLLEWVRTNLFNNAAARFEEVLSDRVLEIGFTESLSDSGKSSDRVLRELRTLRRFLSSSVMGAAFDLHGPPCSCWCCSCCIPCSVFAPCWVRSSWSFWAWLARRRVLLS